MGIGVWPAQGGSGLSWRSPWQAAPGLCTVQQASALRGGCKAETSQHDSCAPVLASSALFLPSAAPRSSVMQVLDTRE